MREVYTVSRLIRTARMLIEDRVGSVWVEGEVSNVSRPGSGHVYFVLKDADSQIRCALFRGQARTVVSLPENGHAVVVSGRATVYEGRGEFQIVVEQVEEAGEGALRRAFEALKRRLAAEGLFETARKRPLPELPKRIGLITSPTGAAVRDILIQLKRRFPSIPVLLHPVPVQGTQAAPAIVAALEIASLRRDCDVLILARGGGSLEDLRAFNEESVARAIAACAIPVVTGVGHETDVTIADLVADLRAATPTAAAVAIVPDQSVFRERARVLAGRLARTIATLLGTRAQRLDALAGRLVRPDYRLAALTARLGTARHRLQNAAERRLTTASSRVERARHAVFRLAPAARIAALRLRLEGQRLRLSAAMARGASAAGHRLQRAAAALTTLNPLNTLARGYSVLTRDDGRLVTRIGDAPPGTAITARLQDGVLIATVTTAIDAGDLPRSGVGVAREGIDA